MRAAGNAHGQEELAGKERELGRTLGGLRGLTSEIGEINRTAGTGEMDRTVNDVDGLTREIVSSANERVRAEERAEVVVKEAKARLRTLAENRAALQESLKALQDTAVSSLMRSELEDQTDDRGLPVPSAHERRIRRDCALFLRTSTKRRAARSFLYRVGGSPSCSTRLRVRPRTSNPLRNQ